MDWIISTTVFLSVLKAALCFNIDPVAWKTVSNSAAGFGYQVVQRQSDLLVSAPLEQLSPTERGQIFKCSTIGCTRVPVSVPSFAVNMSLGLIMTSDPNTQKTLACGPTIPKDCKSITQYSGVCFEIDPYDRVGRPVPSSIEECQSKADIAFLLDGSGSVDYQDFERMKNFVKSVVRSFPGKDTKFSITQFSSDVVTHSYFNTFDVDNWESQINNIRQLTGGTHTTRAIREVVNNVFSTYGGSRPNVKKILIVITDGESNDRGDLRGATNSAERKKIVRFAIGVGSAFRKPTAKQELHTIASSPDKVFQVLNFGALDAIRQNLQDQIFSIEGSQTSGESLKMEMAQMGFSAAYVPQDSTRGIQMSIVGANLWRGGYQEYKNQMLLDSYGPLDIEPDSYLGYSITVANTRSGPLTILGAPRYQHRGIVMSVIASSIGQTIDPFSWQFKIGEYFGAVVCAMDVNRNSYTDLVLISAPMYMDSDREGRVYVCSLTRLKIECHFNSPLILRGDASDQGRFGSSLAVLPDLNQDGVNDLAVGAPLENDGQGSIYIFHGEGGRGGRISRTYSQRIASSEVQLGLKFFGMSISQSSFDRSKDSLPDLAVGSKGTVVLLRSRPIVMVKASVTYNPNQIQTQNSDCSTPLDNTARICFTMTQLSVVNTARAIINYTFTLDAQRKIPKNRASINDNQREQTGSLTLTFEQKCHDVKFFVQACPDDSLNSVNNELQFIFEGLPSDTGLRPSLAQQAQTSIFYPLGFEIDCGTDNECVDKLKVDFNFTGSSVVKVGIDGLLDVTVSVENSHENSYNSRVILTYPPGLSYRKFTPLKGRIECNSLDSGAGLSHGRTDCTIDKPIFKSNAKALFIVSYGIDTTYKLDRTLIITANATSGNQHASGSELYKIKRIDVKYSIYATIESPLSYTNFSHGKNDLQKPVQQPIVLANGNRALNLTVVIRVPVKLGDKDIWVNSNSLQIPDCQKDKDEEPTVKDFVAVIQKKKSVDCSVARCTVFKCNQFMGSLERKTYTISANLSSGWIDQIGLKSTKFLLTSTATLEFDRNQYIFFSPGSNNNPPIHKIETQVEVYAEPDFTKEIVGGSLGGLALLILVTAGLYKAGFFKSKYKNMMNEEQEAVEGAEGGGPTPE